MTISDARFGGEVVTRTGRVLTFDSIECLASWIRAADAKTLAGVYVIDVQHPGTFVDVATAGFLRDAAVMKSPMGRAVLGFASATVAEQQRAMLGGTVVAWTDLVASMEVPKDSKP
jgi:copper chaperone NosL